MEMKLKVVEFSLVFKNKEDFEWIDEKFLKISLTIKISHVSYFNFELQSD
jgi:hypothetical protein